LQGPAGSAPLLAAIPRHRLFDAFGKVHPGVPAEELFGLGNVGLAVAEVTGTRRVERRRDLPADNAIDRVFFI